MIIFSRIQKAVEGAECRRRTAGNMPQLHDQWTSVPSHTGTLFFSARGEDGRIWDVLFADRDGVRVAIVTALQAPGKPAMVLFEGQSHFAVQLYVVVGVEVIL